jgi:DNA polymerase
MDDRQRDELKAWIEFYQELGIEGFYRREAGTVDAPPVIAAPPSVAAALPPKQVASPVQTRVVPIPAPPKPAVSSVPSAAVIRPPTPSFNLFEAAPAPPSGPETLVQIRQDLGDCRRCKLAPTRKTIVFGEGNPHAELVFIGEGPGADEDEQGLPFVGRAGKLLNRMMQTVGLKREDVYICNVVKCRPPGNRTPEKD